MPAKSKIRPRQPTAQQSGAALPTKKFAAVFGVHPCTVWRAVRAGRLAFIVIVKRKLILPPVAQQEVPQQTRGSSATGSLRRPGGKSRDSGS